MIKRVNLAEIFGFVPKRSVSFQSCDPEILSHIRKCLVEKSISELLPDFAEDEDADVAASYPRLQLGSSSGSIPTGVWFSRAYFLQCENEILARLVIENCITQSSH